MNTTKIILPLAAAALLLGSCDDTKMEWGTPEGQYPVSSADIPLAVKEVIANYDNIKTYAAQYTPNLIVGLGFGADQYINNEAYASGYTYRELTDANFQMVTPGNAMKMDAIVTNSGKYNFTTVDNMLAAMAENPDLKLYGHNFIWHTQQNQTYLKSLIRPTVHTVVSSDTDISPLFTGDSQDFNGGTRGSWGSWGNSSSGGVAQPGADGTGYCMTLTNPTDANNWSAQCAYTFDTALDANTEYTIRFKAKSTSSAGVLQFQYQNGSTYGSQGGYNSFNVGTDWATYEYSFTPAYDDANRILLNFGAVAATYYIDDIEFGTKIVDPMDNVLINDDTDFEGGSTGNWGSWGNSSSKDAAQPGYNNSEYCMHLNNPSDANAWSAQCAYTFDTPLESGVKYIIQFFAKSSSASGQLQFQYQNGTTYGSQGGYNTFNITTDWAQYEYEFTPSVDDANRILLNFGAVGGDYYIDNVKFGKAKDQSASARARVFHVAKDMKSAAGRRLLARSGVRRAGSYTYYEPKSAAEKRQLLIDAMDSMICNVAAHLKEKGVTPYGYDVLNEAITDDSHTPRGLNDKFGGSWTDDDGNTVYDGIPTESADADLELNWGSGHFYWGYYIGDDYAAQAFSLARKYLPAETKLFYNDYNLETDAAKRKAVIAFVKDIDSKAGKTVVDGIGTQCHLTLDVSSDDSFDAQIEAFMANVDASLTDLAASGKLVRITELDIALGTESPSSNQLQAQYEAYRRVFESYKRIIPAAQQSGITIWTLTDNSAEHKYWLDKESPNLFDKDGKRKWAYKGVCDGIAGEDLGLKFNGDDYKAWYQKGNTGSW